MNMAKATEKCCGEPNCRVRFIENWALFLMGKVEEGRGEPGVRGRGGENRTHQTV